MKEIKKEGVMSAINVNSSFLKLTISSTQSEQELKFNPKLYDENSNYKKLFDQVRTLLNQESEQLPTLKGLKEIAYDTLAGTGFVKKSHSYNHLMLWLIFFTNAPQPKDVASILVRTYEESLTTAKEENDISMSKEPIVLADSDDLIPVSYGGGMRFFDLFTKGIHQGYAEEANGKGMFVTIQTEDISPTYKHRDYSYAKRTPIKHFDEPITIKGEIPARYLHKVNFNKYEAVIFKEHVKHLTLTKRDCTQTLDLPYLERKEMIQNELPPTSFFNSGPRHVDLEKTLFNKVKDQYDAAQLDRIRDLIYDLYK